MLTKFLNNYGYMILGGAMIIGFSAFKGAEIYAGEADTPVTLYFHGNPSDENDVKDQSLWTEASNSESCNTGNNAACAMVVDLSDVSTGTPGSRSLNPSRITLDANKVGSRYIPSKNTAASDPSSQPISPINKL